ncbi:deoxyribonuclease IV [Candidatus Bipolaricaulota sp. J31]
MSPGEGELLLGCHLSIGKGFPAVLDEAERLGINAVQIFSHSARSWKMKPLDPDEAEAFRARWKGSHVRYFVIHTSYLLNLASPDPALWEKSLASLREEVRRAGELGIPDVVTHLGSHKGAGMERGISRVVEALLRLQDSPEWEQFSNVRLMLELTAGAGDTVGKRFGELAEIIERAGGSERLGICFDTCHAFASGYELRTPEGLEETLRELDRTVGLGRLWLVHLNDSVHPFASNKDRHAHIGRGEIGLEGFRLVVNHPSLRRLPFILETPKEELNGEEADVVNLRTVRSLVEG